MKQLYMTLALVFGLVLGANALTVEVTQPPVHGTSGGGEFILTPTNGDPSFHTFCLERNQRIVVGGTYFYTISDSTDGGVNGGPDPISIGTAWLYGQFRQGTLSGYTATKPQQLALQSAFWYLENEIPSAPNNPYISLVQSALGANVNLFSNANGAYGVNVWNLFDASGRQYQSQLGWEPPTRKLPDNGSTLAFAGLGLLGVACLGRRKQIVE